MEDKPKRLWFKAKRYGWGWYPGTWEGWLVLGMYLAVFAIEAIAMTTFLPEEPSNWHLVAHLTFVFAITSSLIYVCWKTGEKPRWRWGGKD